MSHTQDKDCCKETTLLDRVSVYLQPIRGEGAGDTLVNVMGFTKKQAGLAIEFANKRGECLLFEGDRKSAVSLMENLIKRGVPCQARNKGISK